MSMSGTQTIPTVVAAVSGSGTVTRPLKRRRPKRDADAVRAIVERRGEWIERAIVRKEQ
jgi:hypothetical protein